MKWEVAKNGGRPQQEHLITRSRPLLTPLKVDVEVMEHHARAGEISPVLGDEKGGGHSSTSTEEERENLGPIQQQHYDFSQMAMKQLTRVREPYATQNIITVSVGAIIGGAVSINTIDRLGTPMRCMSMAFHFGQLCEAASVEHPSTLTSMNNLATVWNDQGKYEQAESMHQQALGLTEAVLGKELPDKLTNMNNLATVLSRQGKYKRAEEVEGPLLSSEVAVSNWLRILGGETMICEYCSHTQ